MVRALIAGLAVLGLAACQPSSSINREDPYSSLYPWNPERQGVVTLESGVQYVVISDGKSKDASPTPMDEVEVHYDGRLAADGTKFDSSYERGETATFRLNQVIPGWTEGLQKMKPGDQFMFFIPAAQGYGERGAGGAIPPNADLMFRVELLKVIPAKLSDAEAWKKYFPWPTSSGEVIRTASGLEYASIREGAAEGEMATDQDYARVHFEGRLDDGTVVASTFEAQQPEIFPIAQLVPGWAEALKLMRPGDRWMVRFPAHLMYAGEGDGLIPPNSAVTFEVELEEIIRVQSEPPAPSADQK